MGNWPLSSLHLLSIILIRVSDENLSTPVQTFIETPFLVAI